MTSKNKDIDTENIKNLITKYLYEKVYNSITFLEITKDQHISEITETYHITPELAGVRSWIIIFHHKDKYYSINFPKVSDNYRKKKDWLIYPINVPIMKEYYIGTIMEGIYTKSATNRYLIIDEIYYCKGKDIRNKPYKERMKLIHEFVDTGIKKTKELNIYPVATYPIKREGMLKLYNDLRTNQAIRRILFIPPSIKSKRYFYVVVKSDLIDDIIRTAKLIMIKTKTKDVYHLYNKSNQKIGLAYISTIELSEKILEWYKTAKSSRIIVKCQYDGQKQKWSPSEFIRAVKKAEKAEKTEKAEKAKKAEKN